MPLWVVDSIASSSRLRSRVAMLHPGILRLFAGHASAVWFIQQDHLLIFG